MSCGLLIVRIGVDSSEIDVGRLVVVNEVCFELVYIVCGICIF